MLQLLLRFRELLDLTTLIIEFQLCSTLLYNLGKGQFDASAESPTLLTKAFLDSSRRA